MIHDEFAFDGYLDDGVEDVNMGTYAWCVRACVRVRIVQVCLDLHICVVVISMVIVGI